MQIVTFYKNGRLYKYRKVQERLLDNTDKLISACFTGHRPKDLSGYIPIENYQWIIDMIMYEVFNQYDSGIRKFISGGAQGIDQLAFLGVKKAVEIKHLTDVVNTIYIPFEGQEACWSDTGIFGKAMYYSLVDSADEVVLCNKVITAQDEYYKLVSALDARNKSMLNNSERLLAWYNGRTKGGTFNCIRDAIALGMEVVYLAA